HQQQDRVPVVERQRDVGCHRHVDFHLRPTRIVRVFALHFFVVALGLVTKSAEEHVAPQGFRLAIVAIAINRQRVDRFALFIGPVGVAAMVAVVDVAVHGLREADGHRQQQIERPVHAFVSEIGVVNLVVGDAVDAPRQAHGIQQRQGDDGPPRQTVKRRDQPEHECEMRQRHGNRDDVPDQGRAAEDASAQRVVQFTSDPPQHAALAIAAAERAAHLGEHTPDVRGAVFDETANLAHVRHVMQAMQRAIGRAALNVVDEGPGTPAAGFDRIPGQPLVRAQLRESLMPPISYQSPSQSGFQRLGTVPAPALSRDPGAPLARLIPRTRQATTDDAMAYRVRLRRDDHPDRRHRQHSGALRRPKLGRYRRRVDQWPDRFARVPQPSAVAGQGVPGATAGLFRQRRDRPPLSGVRR
nr:hypothetical protein [Tanacetum cinerariifolium]